LFVPVESAEPKRMFPPESGDNTVLTKFLWPGMSGFPYVAVLLDS
jgi:hypothetical protein